jgi:hypothetical protein
MARFLANWGATTKESGDYLLSLLPSSDSKSRTLTLLKALKRANHAQFPLISRFSADQRAHYAQSLEAYLEHD